MTTKEILIIEDDAKFRNSIKRALKGEGYSFVEAESVQSGINELSEHQNIKAILLDLSLPDGSGEDFLEQIKEHASKYRVVILTAHEEYLVAEKAQDFLVFNYLPKATKSFTQSLRFSVAQAFTDIERDHLKNKTKMLIDIQKKINSDIQLNRQNQINSDIQKSSTKVKTLNDILELICKYINDLVGAYTCHIRLYNLKTGDFDLAAFAIDSNDAHDCDEVKKVFDGPRRKGEFFSGKVADSKIPELFDNLQDDNDFNLYKKQFLEKKSLPDGAKKYLDIIQSAYIVPITTRMFDDETDAVFNVNSKLIGFFSEEKKEIINEFVTQATIAITKAWQKQRKEETHKDYKGISKVLEDISKELRGEDVKKKIYAIVIQGISEIIKPETISIYLYNKTTDRLDNEAEFRGNEQVEPSKESHPTNEGLTGFVFTERIPLRVPNLQNKDRNKPKKPKDHPDYNQKLETDYIGDIPSGRVDHYLGVPMIIGDEVIGAIQLLNKKSDYHGITDDKEHRIKDDKKHRIKERWLLERGFSDDCENVLGIAASHLAVAIKYAELIEELNKKIGQLDTLKDVGRFTSSEMPLDKLLNKIIEEAAKDVQAEICLLFLLDESKSKVVLEQSYGIPKEKLKGAYYEIGKGLTGGVARTGKSVLEKANIPSGKYDKEIIDYLKQEFGGDKALESLMVVPIKAKNKIIGVIKAINKKGDGDQYNEEDLSFFEMFANYVGIAIENARRYELASKKLAIAEIESTLSNLVASVAHEINNTAGLIPDDVDEIKNLPANAKSEQEELLDEIKNLAMQMVVYVNEIEGYSMSKMGERNLLNINSVVHTALRQIPQARKISNIKNIVLKPNLSEEPLMCSIYKTPFIQTIRNIVINAYQALEEKGRGEIIVTTYKDTDSDMAKIEIADNGCGIKEDHKSKIFDIKFSTKGVRGNGIGLWLAMRHLDTIGGRISFESVEKQGTTFILSIPISH